MKEIKVGDIVQIKGNDSDVWKVTYSGKEYIYADHALFEGLRMSATRDYLLHYHENSLVSSNDSEDLLEQFRKEVEAWHREAGIENDKAAEEEIEPFLFEPPEEKPKCDHEWVESMGLEKMYKDCKKCNAKWEDINEKA